ncbi:MAG: hypothetical protein Q9224_000533 [Gallowayella concinna]
MPGRRIIQDSDEEDNGEESPLRQSKQAASPPLVSPNGLDISSSAQQKQSLSSAAPSTASTELLHREIQNAHISLLESSTSSSARPSLPSSTSSSITKRRDTTVLDGERVKKPKITYGGRKCQEEASFNFKSDDEGSIRPAKRARRDMGTGPYQDDEYADGGRDCHTTSTSLGGIRTRRSNTEPSTIPQTIEHKTKRQQEAMTADGSMPPPASRSSGATPQDVQSSEASRCPTTERASSPLVPPVADNEFSGVHISNSEKSQLAHSGPSTIITSSSASSQLPKRALSMLTPPTILLGEEISPSSSAPASSPVKRAGMDFESQDIGISKAHGHPDHGHDELSLSVKSSPSSTRKQTSAIGNSSSTRTKRKHEPELDDLVLDLPPEQYQPRPSRSRSALAADDIVVPTDFSKRPESLAKNKNKSKRQKTAATQEFDRPTRTSPKRRQAKAKPRAPDERIENERVGEKGGNESNPALEDELGPQPDTDTVLPTEFSPSKPLPAKKTRGRPKKDFLADQDVNPATPGPLPICENNPPSPSKATKPASAPTPAKRGRKRKKAPAEELSNAVVHEDDLVSDKEQGNPGLLTETVLIETDPNAQPSRIGYDYHTSNHRIDQNIGFTGGINTRQSGNEEVARFGQGYSGEVSGGFE